MSDQPAVGQPHEIVPVCGTYVRESDGEWEHVGPSKDSVTDLILAKWKASPHERHRVALALAKDLKTEAQRGDRIESIEKLAIRYDTSTSAARAARFLLLSVQTITKQGSHYYLT